MIASGRARDTFREVIRLQGGDARVVDDPSRLPRARSTGRESTRPRAGFVTAIHCEQVGVASMLLGGGREKKEDSVDPAWAWCSKRRSAMPVKGWRDSLHRALQPGRAAWRSHELAV